MSVLPGKTLFGGGGPSAPDPLPPVPTPEDPSVKKRGEEVSAAAKRRRGLIGTIKTSGLGDTSAVPTERKKLLGSGSSAQA